MPEHYYHEVFMNKGAGKAKNLTVLLPESDPGLILLVLLFGTLLLQNGKTTVGKGRLKLHIQHCHILLKQFRQFPAFRFVQRFVCPGIDRV